MGENTKIEWTDHTLNFWWGCVRNPRLKHVGFVPSAIPMVRDT